MKALPTLEDVAKESGVSTATVSRVVNNPSRVRGETRKLVEDAIAKLGYTPHFGGRALASNRTNTIGAVIPTMENAIFAQGLQALQEELAASGVTLLVATSNYDPMREAEQIRALLGRGVDGLVLIGEERDEDIYALLESRNLPFVLVWWWRESCPWRCVGFDNRVAARAIAERVLDYGHTRIAMIAGVSSGNDRARLRVDGVRDALSDRGLTLQEGSLIEAPYTFDGGAKAARQLLAREDRPTAIICGNDILAAGAISALRQAELCAPDDVSVTGFDDIELARLISPQLTTVHVPHRRMGRSAAQLLLRLRDGDEDAESIVFTPKLIERESLSAV